ncbi:RNA polymerase sigma factor [Desulfovibrio ferrophilus]|uniref:RNA polymerase, sigma-24 subunit, ECF subfamily n=1 Tax=Desulfovibrio ferrophilus TaxID=241368 RepID=A0A2Z6AWR7_9BACT|nr:sigma-70 family RNA polymerase sigma factor [Desulfovibrio ferrophilus]BBD07660.1 RNA polymerase, sigma-24 subunit, ECF subfamily [Desulfovibrio ferrophilus]
MSTTMDSTVDLHSCINGDKKSWNGFVDRYMPVVYAGVKKVIQSKIRRVNPEDIRDVTQNVFIRLVKRDFHLLRRYDSSRCSMVTYLTIIARSTALDFVRYGFFNSIPLDDFDRDLRVEAEEPFPGPEFPKGVLTERQLTVMRLLFCKDYDVSMAADALGIKAQTIRSIKHQALTRLRDHYNDEVRAS